MSTLPEIIRAEILHDGRITFHRFMELALYEPQTGYYTAGRAGIGRAGDYFTNVSVGPLYGRLLGQQFAEMWTLLGAPAEFAIVEQGANSGDFAHDVLTSLSESAPDFFRCVRYSIVEPVPALAQQQREKLADFAERVTWTSSVEDLPHFTGVHFSNELLDAMPVHLVVNRNGAWRERYATLDANGDFSWVEDDFSTDALAAYIPHLPAVEGYETEINLDAPRWLDSIAARLGRGYVLAVDYGFARSDFYQPERIRGTLTCYRKHQRFTDPLRFAGEQDITAHVEFTTLAERAERAGLCVAGFADQHHFMAGLAKYAFPNQTEAPTAQRQRELRALATLMHPTTMGRSFQFFTIAKDAPSRLRGYEFASDPRRALGLS